MKTEVLKIVYPGVEEREFRSIVCFTVLDGIVERHILVRPIAPDQFCILRRAPFGCFELFGRSQILVHLVESVIYVLECRVECVPSLFDYGTEL